ncbi:calmodulin-binding transcription activator 4-like isoform X2 [Gastrolobium bilobum]|uniref:calmodulin-binding transcription activator 4-like isoform X2 n=1 Tax=Gastrolobium bilobum TaxID=150636 RepID=UPI002AB19DAC|nr:calmodulin-binding transcription activator 4-like isoform X2 [Gastrolobium bilobum]
MPPGFEYNINDLYQEAKKRWLKPVEVLYILRNHDKCEFTHQPPQQPTGGSLFLFNKRVMRFFRKDGHNWRKKKDGKTVGEAHERLKVGNVEILNCYYAHGEENRTFQRRSYWMLDPEYEHIVLVHYRETSEGKSNSGPVTQLSPVSSLFSRSHSSSTSQNPVTTSMFGESNEPIQNFSSPGSLEVTSDVFISNNIMDNLDGTEAQALRQLEEQLSLNEDEIVNDLIPYQDQRVVHKQDKSAAFSGPDDCGQPYDGYNGRQDDSGEYYHELLAHDCPHGNQNTLSWTEVLESCKPLSVSKLPDQHVCEAFGNEKSLSYSERGLIANSENSHWLNSNSNNAENSVFSFPPDVGEVKFPPYSLVETQGINSEYYATLFDPFQIQEPLHTLSLTVPQKQKFTIKAVSPECCYATETTKVFIIGTFLCLPFESTWACMFGDVEVPAEIIQDGVICCEAPSHLLGKVTLCITSGNREPCSEVREFEFRNKTNSCSRCDSLETEAARSPQELLLLVQFAQMLVSASTIKDDNIESGSDLQKKQKADDDSWSHIIEALLDGSGTSSGTTDWLLEELLKDKLQLWLSSKSHERDEGTGCSLSKKEQGIIHMVSGLGFEWALNPILSCGVNINFRDINGWTALHWAARFGREKMVASLIASGAFAGAVTDPTAQDPTGKTAASIAASSGYKGLAGYLSEVDLTSHLSSLTLEKSEISKGSAELAAELTVSSVSEDNLVAGEDQVSLKDTLGAVRNAALAAALIQAAFRALSFRKRREREAAAASAGLDGYGMNAGSIDDTISLLPPMSKLSSRSLAALSIQKKYRGWKGRKEFLALRQKVVKIQAHVRGYQVRKHYKLIIWAVGVLDKVVLRWRRKGAGLRGFRQEMESLDESDDEDFLRVFRKEKVHVAIEKAFSRVLSMVHSTHARQQYSRMLEMYRQAKAEVGSTSDEAPLGAASNIEDDDDDLYQLT